MDRRTFSEKTHLFDGVSGVDSAVDVVEYPFRSISSAGVKQYRGSQSGTNRPEEQLEVGAARP